VHRSHYDVRPLAAAPATSKDSRCDHAQAFMHQQQQLRARLRGGGRGETSGLSKKCKNLKNSKKVSLLQSLLPLTHTRLLRSSAYARYGLYFKASTLESTESPAVIAAFHNTRSS